MKLNVKVSGIKMPMEVNTVTLKISVTYGMTKYELRDLMEIL